MSFDSNLFRPFVGLKGTTLDYVLSDGSVQPLVGTLTTRRGNYFFVHGKDDSIELQLHPEYLDFLSIVVEDSVTKLRLNRKY